MKREPSEITLQGRRLVAILRLKAKIAEVRESRERSEQKFEQRIAKLTNELTDLEMEATNAEIKV